MMKKVLLVIMGSLLLTSAYAINPPASPDAKPADKTKNYGGASFISKPEDKSAAPSVPPAKKAGDGTIDPLSTLSPNQNTVLSQVDTSNIQIAAANPVKTDAGCPVTCPQKTGIFVKKELIKKIVNRQVNSSNAHEIEQLMGPACSCITFNPLSAEVWTCQWKGDLASNRLENTINVTFEGGMLASVTAVRGDGVTYMALPNANVTVYQPQ